MRWLLCSSLFCHVCKTGINITSSGDLTSGFKFVFDGIQLGTRSLKATGQGYILIYNRHSLLILALGVISRLFALHMTLPERLRYSFLRAHYIVCTLVSCARKCYIFARKKI